MTPETLKALKGSIKKWKEIIDGTVEDNGPDNCPLCKKFYENNCKGCPVKNKTGHSLCNGTPYDLWNELSFEDTQKGDLSKAAMVAAGAELMFLESLLPRRKR